MPNLFSDLFINGTILVSFISFGNQLFREKWTKHPSPWRRKVLVGVLGGILGCLLMLYSVQLESEVILDFRNIPIIITALYFGFTSSMMAALTIGIFRILYFGLNQAAAFGFWIAFLMGVVSGFIGKLPIKNWIKWVLAVLFIYLIAGIYFTTILKNSPLLGEVLSSYFLGTAVLSCAMFFFIEYLEESNRRYYKMKDESKRDFLTGLNNTRQFSRLLNHVMAKAAADNQRISLLFIDIDNFKKINDTYGHLEGDGILKELGDIFNQACRSSDMISRNGGEEFSVILVDCPLQKAVAIGERIRSEVERNDFTLGSGIKIKVTVSIGVSSFPETTEKVADLLDQADLALYKAKQGGRNRVVVAG